MVQYMMYTITSTAAAAELLNGKLEMVCLCTYTELKGYVYYYTRHTGCYICNGNKIAICVCMLHVEREGEGEREREREREGGEGEREREKRDGEKGSRL